MPSFFIAATVRQIQSRSEALKSVSLPLAPPFRWAWQRTMFTPRLARKRAWCARSGSALDHSGRTTKGFSRATSVLTAQKRTALPLPRRKSPLASVFTKPDSPASFSFRPRRSSRASGRKSSRAGAKVHRPGSFVAVGFVCAEAVGASRKAATSHKPLATRERQDRTTSRPRLFPSGKWLVASGFGLFIFVPFVPFVVHLKKSGEPGRGGTRSARADRWGGTDLQTVILTSARGHTSAEKKGLSGKMASLPCFRMQGMLMQWGRTRKRGSAPIERLRPEVAESVNGPLTGMRTLCTIRPSCSDWPSPSPPRMPRQRLCRLAGARCRVDRPGRRASNRTEKDKTCTRCLIPSAKPSRPISRR